MVEWGILQCRLKLYWWNIFAVEISLIAMEASASKACPEFIEGMPSSAIIEFYKLAKKVLSNRILSNAV